MEKQIVKDMLSKYSCVVIWGLKDPTSSTQRHIHRHKAIVLSKLGCHVLWCENTIENNNLIPNNSLIISSNECCSNIQYRKQNWYALWHTVEPIQECKNYLRMFIYGASKHPPSSTEWNVSTFFDKGTHMLFHSLVTDLLPEEFYPPVFTNSKAVNWVGSIWNDQNNHGNTGTIECLRQALAKRKLTFVHYKGISDEENVIKVRESRIAPSIGGDFQTIAMLPCRLWKNISYGQLGVTNLSKSVSVFDSSIVFDLNIDNLVEKSLSISKEDYILRCAEQQKKVAKDYTYLNFFYNICRAFDELETG